MTQLVLALNSGSSSLKASLLEGRVRHMSCLAEMLGTPNSVVHMVLDDDLVEEQQPNLSHEQVLRIIVDHLKDRDVLQHIVAVGHRVVHGGTIFTDSAIMEEENLQKLDTIEQLAPLHNPTNVAGIRWMRAILPEVPSVAIFDTSFHSTIPEKAYTYPLPKAYRDLGMRKFGFHGTSVKFVSHRVTEILQMFRPENSKDFNMVVCHLGSGASVTAVVGERSMDTSMGFTPLAGLMMGTRCGSVDPSVVGFACETLGKTVEEVMSDFNSRSGLKGMVDDGDSYDMRALLQRKQDGDPKATLALDMFLYRLAQHIAASMIALQGPLDALVFTAGIGEHSAEIRQRTMELLKPVLPQVELDEDRNNNDGDGSMGVLSKEGTWPLVLDIPTDEEAMIGCECLRLLKKNSY